MPIRILLIDDERDFRELFGSLLSFKGYEVETACDGMEGLEKLRGGGFDLVLIDLMMPRLDGAQFCRIVRDDDALRSTPVIILSAVRRAREFLNGVEPICADAFEKMAAIDEVGETIDRVLATRAELKDHRSTPLCCECA